ncbi:MAG TPA: MarR family transcriptional regulator [Epulopiscium sp.]|nr:MarR family transcriptional regulator [Candidatus Epulonipiscium sp.]
MARNSIRLVNELLVELFNDILTIEKAAISEGPFDDISLTEMHTIEAIGPDALSMTDVADKLGITVGTLTTAINRLVIKGYVERNRSEEDRRVVEIGLSKKGRLAFKIHEAFHREMVRNMIDGLSIEGNEVLIQSLSNLNTFFKEKYHLAMKK